MKRVLIGGFLSLIGSIWAMAVLFVYDYGGGNGAVGSVWHGDPFRCSGDCDHDG